MWLHIISNDEKFYARIKSLYDEVAPGQNVYRVFGQNAKTSFAALLKNKKDFLNTLYGDQRWNGIIFNPLAGFCWSWLESIPKNIPVVWYRWGIEGHQGHPTLRNSLYKTLYMPETKKVLFNLNKIMFIKRTSGILNHLNGYFLTANRAFQRVDFYVGPEKEEFDIFRKVDLLSSSAQWLFGLVGTLEDTVTCATSSEDTLGTDIRVGHSADPAGNHIETFRWLSNFNLSGIKVIVPLSYGNPSYRDIILQKGNKILGNHFEPITEYLPLHRYNELMQRCGFVVMNHTRQQGLGNIIADLWRGSKVFMNNTSSYRTLVGMGLSSELMSDQTESTFFTRKPQHLVSADRGILQEKFGRNSIIKATKLILDQCRLRIKYR